MEPVLELVSMHVAPLPNVTVSDDSRGMAHSILQAKPDAGTGGKVMTGLPLQEVRKTELFTS